MDQLINVFVGLITGFVDRILVPMVDAVIPVITGGLGFVIFALLWIAFAYALIQGQGSLDDAWRWVRGLPLLVQGVAWLLFLPVLIGLWIWETTWPLVLRLVLIVGIAGWNLLVFLPRAIVR
jgi:Trk-type K+ transport system membrane component